MKMSAKNSDNYNRWRDKTVAFRVSPQGDKQIDRYVRWKMVVPDCKNGYIKCSVRKARMIFILLRLTKPLTAVLKSKYNDSKGLHPSRKRARGGQCAEFPWDA